MSNLKNLDFDLATIVETFQLIDNEDCNHLQHWVSATYELNVVEKTIMQDLHLDLVSSGKQMNEDELKARMIGLLFYAARIDVLKKIRVFYQRPIAATINKIPLSVICDCMVAAPIVNAPKKPYFFLQEFKKKKGEKKDPEAQMLIAMLIAQHLNQDDKPIYGGFLIGTSWQFATLIGQSYCVSNVYEATKAPDLFQIVFILRRLKELILNR
jgi:hypothetical protein